MSHKHARPAQLACCPNSMTIPMVDQTSKSEPLSNNDAQHQSTSDTDSVKATPDQKTDAAKSTKGKDKEPQFDPNRPRRFRYGEYLGCAGIAGLAYELKWLQDHADASESLSYAIGLTLIAMATALLVCVGLYLLNLAKQDNAWLKSEKKSQEEANRTQKEQSARNTAIQHAKLQADTEESKLRIKHLEVELKQLQDESTLRVIQLETKIEQLKLQNALLRAKIKPLTPYAPTNNQQDK